MTKKLVKQIEVIALQCMTPQEMKMPNHQQILKIATDIAKKEYKVSRNFNNIPSEIARERIRRTKRNKKITELNAAYERAKTEKLKKHNDKPAA